MGIFFQIYGGADKKKINKNALFRPVNWSFSVLFFFNISRENSQTSKANQQSVLFFLKYFIILLKIWTGQSLLTVSLSKIHRQNLKNTLFFSTKQIIFRVGG